MLSTGAAVRRAQLHVNRGDRDGFVAYTDTYGSRRGYINVGTNYDTYFLPVWRHPATNTIFISTVDLRWNLGIRFDISDIREWFVMNEIPMELLLGHNDYN